MSAIPPPERGKKRQSAIRFALRKKKPYHPTLAKPLEVGRVKGQCPPTLNPRSPLMTQSTCRRLGLAPHGLQVQPRASRQVAVVAAHAKIVTRAARAPEATVVAHVLTVIVEAVHGAKVAAKNNAKLHGANPNSCVHSWLQSFIQTTQSSKPWVKRCATVKSPMSSSMSLN